MGRLTSGRLVGVAMLAVALTAAPAAAESGLYIGGSVGQTRLEIDGLDLDLDGFDFSADDTSYKAIVGYRFLGFFAVEASWLDFGDLADSFDSGAGEPVAVSADLEGFDVVAMGMLPLAIFDVFAKAGVVVWDADIETAYGTIRELDSDSGSDLVLGLGAQVRFGGLAVRGEVEYFDIADSDSVYLISVGATFTF